jgi:hypothetical protein
MHTSQEVPHVVLPLLDFSDPGSLSLVFASYSSDISFSSYTLVVHIDEAEIGSSQS